MAARGALCKKAADDGLQGFVELPSKAPISVPKISEATHKAITVVTEWITANP